MLLRLWRDESGAILSAELVLLMTIVVIGLTVGMKAMVSSIKFELVEVGRAIGAVSQDFGWKGESWDSDCAQVKGSCYTDLTDPVDNANFEYCDSTYQAPTWCAGE